ncbi:DUF4411 family protein [Xanthobacter sp. DSM 24535]|uniref:DUF4411 family protein n=1 Tax=Roseixanthobacter psychrophilus TaxID=3119917 RepID=UPI0037282C73
MMFLFDTNVFIEAKNRYYAFDICPGFWDWMDHVVQADAGSIVMVRDELCNGGDELADWTIARRDHPWFLKVDDGDTQAAFAAIAAHVARGIYTDAAKANFLSGADPWLIAKAQVIGATLVTHEVAAPLAKKRVPIPNVCNHFRVPYLNTFDALRGLAGTFSFNR